MLSAAAIFGSPRKKGSSSLLHEEFLSSWGKEVEVERIYVYERDIRPCIACSYCSHAFGCVFNDDMRHVYDTLRRAVMVSISSPLYFSSLTGQLKCLIDRCQVFWELRRREPEAILPKTGFFIATGGGNYPGMFTPSITVVRHFFNSIGCAHNERDYLLQPDVESAADVGRDSLDIARATGAKYYNDLIAQYGKGD